MASTNHGQSLPSSYDSVVIGVHRWAECRVASSDGGEGYCYSLDLQVEMVFADCQSSVVDVNDPAPDTHNRLPQVASSADLACVIEEAPTPSHFDSSLERVEYDEWECLSFFLYSRKNEGKQLITNLR